MTTIWRGPTLGRGLATVLLAASVGTAGLAAQVEPAAPAASSPALAAARSGSQPFAWPWEIAIDQVDEAMAGASYEIEQIRRVLDRSDLRRVPSWIRVRERLRHVAATASSPERFQLELLGLENRSLPPFEVQLRAAIFAQKAEFIYRYQSFRVTDVALAAENYALTLFGISVRLGQPVYQVAVTSKVGPRSAWYLELALETGYPLYRAEYDIDGRLVGEVEVTAYRLNYTGAGMPPRQDKSAQKTFASPTEAVASLGLTTKGVPQAGVLPEGYVPVRSQVSINPLNGRKTARLVYSDGVDQVFVIVAEDREHTFSGTDYVVGVHQDAVGVTQCLFAYRGVQYIVIGRGADEPVREITHRLYSQVVQ